MADTNTDKLLKRITNMRNKYQKLAEETAEEVKVADAKGQTNHWNKMTVREADYRNFVYGLNRLLEDFKEQEGESNE